MSRQHLVGIQAGRGIAALLVVVCHAAEIAALPKYAGAHLAGGILVPLGFGGVDFFFCLSGFIIYYIHAKDIGRPAELPRYSARRLIRIYPIYWVILAFFVATYFVVPSFGMGYERRWDVLLRSFFLIPFPDDLKPTIVAPAWTLTYELIFYTIFSFLIVSRRAGKFVMAAWLLCLVAARLLPEQPFPLNVLLYTRNIEFFLGIGVAMLVMNDRRPWRGVGILGGAIYVGAAIAELHTFPFRHSVMALGYGIGSTLVLWQLASAELRNPLFRVPSPLRLLGDASYSVYLAHVIFVSGAAKILKMSGAYSHLPLAIPLAGMTVAGVAGGVAFHLIIEKRLLRAAQRAIMPLLTQEKRPLLAEVV